MVERTTIVTQSETPEAFTADRMSFWYSFTRFTTMAVMAVAVIVVLLIAFVL